jgi:DNA (cytosine-5)-methyltransferase 1
MLEALELLEILERLDLVPPIKVFDFFTGCGGTCRGFQNAGMDIVFALDNDPVAEKTFKRNFPDVEFKSDNIENVPCEELQPLIDLCKGHPLLFSGCAPCQPFTKQKTTKPKEDIRRTLLIWFLRFIEYYRPEFIFVENVPGIQKINDKEGPFKEFIISISAMGYQYKSDIVTSQSYGVPQMRRRFVLIASRLGPIDFPCKTHGPDTDNEYSCVREWIADLPPIAAGETHPTVLNHRAAALSETNLERIGILKEGEGRVHWPENLRLKCHTNGYTGHTDVYGRIKWDSPATGLTTRCISLSNGRFGHPEQNRAISVREAACLQTFPRDFVFEGNLNSMARQIGNAVPVLLAEKFGSNFVDHFNSVMENKE